LTELGDVIIAKEIFKFLMDKKWIKTLLEKN